MLKAHLLRPMVVLGQHCLGMNGVFIAYWNTESEIDLGCAADCKLRSCLGKWSMPLSELHMAKHQLPCSAITQPMMSQPCDSSEEGPNVAKYKGRWIYRLCEDFLSL